MVRQCLRPRAEHRACGDDTLAEEVRVHMAVDFDRAGEVQAVTAQRERSLVVVVLGPGTGEGPVALDREQPVVVVDHEEPPVADDAAWPDLDPLRVVQPEALDRCDRQCRDPHRVTLTDTLIPIGYAGHRDTQERTERRCEATETTPVAVPAVRTRPAWMPASHSSRSPCMACWRVWSRERRWCCWIARGALPRLSAARGLRSSSSSRWCCPCTGGLGGSRRMLPLGAATRASGASRESVG